jgi:membrane protein DedA with SNARE-associated domain
MGISEAQIIEFFAGYAYQPMFVYGAVMVLMFLSSFGFPAPEEITLISTGLVCYMGSRPDLYPPPYEGAAAVNVYIASAVCLGSVFASDLLVFTLGRRFGLSLFKTRLISRYQERIKVISEWTEKYGQWAAGIFRFTPGLRFPGHLSCGMLGLSYPRFMLVDGGAALISVPTQVMIVAFFGEEILIYIKQFKVFVFIFIAIIILYFVVKKLLNRKIVKAASHLDQGPNA